MKSGRNSPYPCGSGEKYKNCHNGQPTVRTIFKKSPLSSRDDEFKALMKYNRTLQKVASEITSKEFFLKSDKDRFAAFCLGKAYKTHDAILSLCKQGLGQDAAMLVRSLVDLLITLLYILKDSTDKTMHRYIAHDWIIRKKMYARFKDDPKAKEAFEERKLNPKPNDNSPEFVEEQAKLAQEKYKFGNNWSGKNIREMAVGVSREQMYDTVFRLQSQLSHTNPRAVNEYVSEIDSEFVIEIGSSERWIDEALVSTFDCYYNIVGEYDKLLKLGFAKNWATLPKIISKKLVK